MTVRFGAQATGTDDPRYRQGVTHLQLGAWTDAIRCFEDLARDYPDSPAVRRLLDEARFKANLDATTQVRPKRLIIPWRPILIRGLILLVTIFLAIQGVRLVRGPVAEALQELQAQQTLAQLEEEGDAFFEAGDLDNAEARYRDLLDRDPNHQGALDRLDQIAEEREMAELYQQAVAFQEAGEYEKALELFELIRIRRPRYRDVSLRIEDIEGRLDQAARLAEAEALYQAGLFQEALAKYEELRELYLSHERDLVESRLYELYMRLGRALIEQDPPALEGIPQALSYFVGALSLRPRSTEATLEKDLAEIFLDGQRRYQAGRWEEAIARLRAVYDLRPDYLRGTVVGMLYEAYIRSGDQYRDAAEPDCGLAYQRYGDAAALPLADTTLAEARRAAILYCVPPTPTPSNTPTPTLTPTVTPYPTPTAIASATPVPSATPTPTPIPLDALRNRIVFQSDNEDEPGVWAMDPSGGNRIYLGPSSRYRAQIEAFRERERLSPDGNYRLFVAEANRKPQVFIAQPKHPEYGDLPHIQLTKLTGMSYDPVWSPAGDRVAFVSQDEGSDDIWIINADGTKPRSVTVNDWEWDKHPSWSPDGSRIVFWSNRTGVGQIYVMDGDGGNVRVLASTTWAEYDPIWIK